MRTRLLAGAVLALLSGAPAALAAQPDTAKRAVRPRTLYEDLQLLSGVLSQIRVNHPDSVDAHELIMAAIRGMVHQADPYSGVTVGLNLSEEKVRLLREGKLHPVPLDFIYRGGAAIVAGVTPGTSAAKAEILPGDELIAIDGEMVLAETPQELDLTLRGPKKSRVKLTFERRRSDGTTVQFEREVRREEPDEQTNVPVAFMLDGQTGYVRITEFGNTRVADDLHDRLGQLEKRGMRRLVLDVRDNPGGLVSEASAVAGEFLPKGAIVYTTFGRKRDVIDTGRVTRSFFSREKRYPIVLLVNEGSASASELVAGALQDHDRALVVGRPTHGKSLVMLTLPVGDGRSYINSWIYLNVGRVRTPCGRVVQREYRNLTRREYYRRAGEVRDTTGRPSCRTAGGRTVYGGGGVYPDVMLPVTRPIPPWLSMAFEQALVLRWVGRHLDAHGAAYPSLDALAAKPALAPGAVADFRAAATAAGIAIPDGADADRTIEATLLPRVADAKWGNEGRYRIEALLDPEIKLGVEAFGKAAEILPK